MRPVVLFLSNGLRENLFMGASSVEHVGLIDKQQKPSRFLAELRSCQTGVLLSCKEAFGIVAL